MHRRISKYPIAWLGSHRALEYVSVRAKPEAERKGQPTLKEVGDALPDSRNAVAGAVGSYGPNMLKKPLCTLSHVALVAELVQEHIFVVEQGGVLEETEDLAEESDGLLIELLGVADVGRDNLGEGKIGQATLEVGAVLLRLDGELTTDGIFSGLHMRIDIVDIEAFPGGGPHGASLDKGSQRA